MTTIYHFAVYDLATGEVRRAGYSTNRRARVLERRNLAPGEAIYCLGPIDPKTTYLPGGIPTPKPEVVRVVSEQDVKAHAGRLLSYTDWYVTRQQEGGADIPADILTYRQAVRDASGVLEAMDPIPADYRDPKYWPAQP